MSLSGGRNFANLYSGVPPNMYKPPDLVIQKTEMNDVFNPYGGPNPAQEDGPHRYPIAGKKKKEEHQHGSLNGALDMETF